MVLQSGNAGIPHGGVGLFNNGYLPGQHQASVIKADGALPLANIKPGEADAAQRRRLGFIHEVDQAFAEASREPQVEAAIRNYETAYRMQAAVPEICDLSGESVATKAMYGLDSPDPLTAGYARQALLARRLVEKGVRFVELSCLSGNIGGGNAANPWDHHGAIVKGHGMMAHQVDQPIAALLKDLKQRGLLDSTLVVWGGEFGRTPMVESSVSLGRSQGRDHHPQAFSMWMAGGGIKGGQTIGETDEMGFNIVKDEVRVPDLQATILHCLGVDHERLTFRNAGLDFRLTGVEPCHVVKKLLA